MYWDFILRIFIAGILGGVIGLEREYRSKEAGFRTHLLVALGSALFMILSHSGFGEILARGDTNISLDPSRIASQVVTGIGFIGTGIIIFQKHVVRGLTTAAGLWVTAAIGMTCGSGMYLIAVSATVMVLACLEILYLILRRFGTRSISLTLSSSSRDSIQRMICDMKDEHIDIDSYEVKESPHTDGTVLVVAVDIKMRGDRYEARIFDFVGRYEDVYIDKIE